MATEEYIPPTKAEKTMLMNSHILSFTGPSICVTMTPALVNPPALVGQSFTSALVDARSVCLRDDQMSEKRFSLISGQRTAAIDGVAFTFRRASNISSRDLV